MSLQAAENDVHGFYSSSDNGPRYETKNHERSLFQLETPLFTVQLY